MNQVQTEKCFSLTLVCKSLHPCNSKTLHLHYLTPPICKPEDGNAFPSKGIDIKMQLNCKCRQLI